MQADSITALFTEFDSREPACILGTGYRDDPTGFGRVERDKEGRFTGVVEQKDATEEQLAIREINPSYYCFRTGMLFDHLSRVSNENASGEYYITDIFRLMLDAEHGVSVVAAVPPEDVLSINTLEHLAEVDSILKSRLIADGDNQ